MSHFPSPHPPLLPSVRRRAASASPVPVPFSCHDRADATRGDRGSRIEGTRAAEKVNGRANLHIGFGVAFAEETRGDRGKERVKLSQQPTASGVHRRGQM